MAMADTYFLNGTVSGIQIVLNGGASRSLSPLDLQNASLDMTTKFGLAAAPRVDVLGFGENEVRVTIGGPTYIYDVFVSAPVTNVLDVQFIVYENDIQPKNTTQTDGFEIRRRQADMAAAQGVSGV
jgi:hypothetical protein